MSSSERLSAEMMKSPGERSLMAAWSVRLAFDRGNNVRKGRRMDNQNLLSQAPPCFGRRVKPLDPDAFPVVRTHSSLKG
jgi:hypothetical protein